MKLWRTISLPSITITLPSIKTGDHCNQYFHLQEFFVLIIHAQCFTFCYSAANLSASLTAYQPLLPIRQFCKTVCRLNLENPISVFIKVGTFQKMLTKRIFSWPEYANRKTGRQAWIYFLFSFYRTQVSLGSDLWVHFSLTN